MPRFTFGPPLGTVSLVAPGPVDPNGPSVPPTPGTKADVAVMYAGVTPEGLFSFMVPMYDLATTNRLDAIHVGLYPAPEVPPSVPGDVVNAKLHFSKATLMGTAPSFGSIKVDATESPVGTFAALAVLEFES